MPHSGRFRGEEGGSGLGVQQSGRFRGEEGGDQVGGFGVQLSGKEMVWVGGQKCTVAAWIGPERHQKEVQDIEYCRTRRRGWVEVR